MSLSKVVTVENLADCTSQEVFDYVAWHLISQGRQSMDAAKTTCMYWNGELSCAGGCLMPYKWWEQNIKDKTVRGGNANSALWRNLVNCGIVRDDHRFLIQDLQTVHDTFTATSHLSEREFFQEGLEKVAKEYELSLSLVKQHPEWRMAT